MVFLAEVRNGLMMEGFTEAIGVIAQVGVEGVGQGVAFCLEQKAGTVVLGKGLIDHGSRAVGRDEQSEERWFLRWHVEGVFAVGSIGRL